MGFRGREFHLEWPEGHQLHGLEVTCRPLSTADLLDIWEWSLDETPEGRRAAALARGRMLAGMPEEGRAPVIKAWNHEDDDGNVLPISEQSMRNVDHAELVAITNALALQSGGIPDPLSDGDSDAGELESSMPMEFPENLAN